MGTCHSWRQLVSIRAGTVTRLGSADAGPRVKARVEGADGAHGPSPVSSDSPAPLAPAASTHAVHSPRAAGKVVMVDKPEPDWPSRSRANRVGGQVGGSPL